MLGFLALFVLVACLVHATWPKATVGLAHDTGVAIEQTAQQSHALPVSTIRDNMASVKFSDFVRSQYTMPWNVLRLPKGSMHDMGAVTKRFYEMFDATILQEKSDSQCLQVLCSAFLILLLINSHQTVTTHVTNNNLTVQAENITVMQEMDGLKSTLANQSSQLEQWALAWGHNMRFYEHQCNKVQALETELRVMRERARCAPPYFDVVQLFLQHNCIVGDEERVGTAELHAAFMAFLKQSQLTCDEPPNQRELRSFLENMGFHYDQVYLRGSNTRGFRGLGLKPSHPALPHEGL